MEILTFICENIHVIRIRLLPENVREMSEGFSSIHENNKDALLFNTIFKITIYFADRKA